MGRYTRSDPIGFKDGINLYSYVGGNPLKAVDIRGLSSKSFAKKLKNFWDGFNYVNTGISICSCSQFISLAQDANKLCRKEHDLYIEEYGMLEGDINYMGKYNAGYPSEAYLSCTGNRLEKLIGSDTLQKYYRKCFDAAVLLITLPL